MNTYTYNRTSSTVSATRKAQAMIACAWAATNVEMIPAPTERAAKPSSQHDTEFSSGTGFGLDSLIEIGASIVVIWELSGTGEDRQRKAMRLIGGAFVALVLYLLVQSTWVLAVCFHAHHSPAGIGWTTVTAVVMFALAFGKARIGTALDNPVLTTEGRITLIDGLLATAVLLGLVLNAALGFWWADPLAGCVLVYHAVREARAILTGHH